jgi:hypothetical protein
MARILETLTVSTRKSRKRVSLGLNVSEEFSNTSVIVVMNHDSYIAI